MKILTMILLLILPILCLAQDASTAKNKNSIGLNLNYGGYYGLTSELLYDRQVGKGFYLRGAVLTNHNSLFKNKDMSLLTLKLGIHKTLFDHKYFDLDIGLNLTSNYYDYSSLGSDKDRFYGSEVPIQLRYHLNSSIDINLGTTFSNTSNSRFQPNSQSLNLGVYKLF